MRWIIFLMITIVGVQMVSAVQIARMMPEWNVTKTGAEVNVDVTIYNLNETYALAIFRPSKDYVTELTKSSIIAEATEVPITKIAEDGKDTNYKLTDFASKEITTLDFTKDNAFLYIYHDGYVNMKVGYNSIVINATSSSDSLNFVMSKKMCKTSDGVYHIAYGGTSSEYPTYANSSDLLTFNSLKIDGNISLNFGILCGEGDYENYILVYYTHSNKAWIQLSTDNGANFGSPTVLAEIVGDPIDYISCVMDEYSNFHCATILDISEDLYYINSTNLPNGVLVSDTLPFESMDIEVSGSCPYIMATESNDDVYIWSHCYNGYGYANRQKIYTGSGFGTLIAGYPIDIFIVGNNLYSCFIDLSDLQFCNSTLDNVGIHTCYEVDSSGSYNCNIVANNQGAYILYTQQNDVSTGWYLANTSNFITWTARTSLLTSTNPAVLGGSNYPVSSRITDKIDIFYISSSTLYYLNKSILYISPDILTNFSVQVADSQTLILFNSTNKTAVHLSPKGQTNGQPIFNVTNNGNVNLNVTLQLNMSLEAGFSAYWDTDNNPSGSKRLNETRQLITVSLAPSSKQSIWLWTNFTNQLPNQFDRNMTVAVNQTT